MKRMMINYTTLLLLVVALPAISFAQEWKKLVPQLSTCVDIKKVFAVEVCTFPISNYKLRDFSVGITFSKNRRDPKVLRVRIVFNKLINLKTFESDLSGYLVLPDDDLLNSRIYRNDEKGISFTAQEMGDGEKYVTSVTLFPRKKKRQRP